MATDNIAVIEVMTEGLDARLTGRACAKGLSENFPRKKSSSAPAKSAAYSRCRNRVHCR